MGISHTRRLRNAFISFEGGEGSGKGTIISLIKKRLEEHDYKTVITREPGGTMYAEAIRNLIFDPDKISVGEEGVHGRTEVLMFCASRAQHIECLVRPMLDDGVVVLCDRFEDSTFAYQGAGRKLPLAHRKIIPVISAFARQDMYPSLTILLDIDPKIGLERKMKAGMKGAEVNRFDEEKLGFHDRICRAYRRMTRKDPKRWRVIDASQTIDRVLDDVWVAVSKHLGI